MLFGFIALAGGGHGWISGAYSCLPLAPVSFVAWSNALRTPPSLRTAHVLLVIACVVLAATAVATQAEGTHYFFDYWRVQGTLGASMIGLVYCNWLFAYALTVRRVSRQLELS